MIILIERDIMKNLIRNFFVSGAVLLASQMSYAADEGLARTELLSEIDLVTVDIDGAAAQTLYNQFVKWGKKVHSCPNNPAVTSVKGTGFGCIKQDSRYTCSSVLGESFIEAADISCPQPSIGGGNRP